MKGAVIRMLHIDHQLVKQRMQDRHKEAADERIIREFRRHKKNRKKAIEK